MDKDEFWHKWSREDTLNAMRYATHQTADGLKGGFPQAIQDDVFEKELTYGMFWNE